MRPCNCVLWALSFSTLASVGCYRGQWSPVAREDGARAHETQNRVSLANEDVRNALLYVDSNAERQSSGRSKAWVHLKNMYRNVTVYADVRFQFMKQTTSDMDAEGGGHEIVDASAWRTVAFPAWELVQIDETSLHPDATSCNIQVKNLRTNNGGTLYRRDSLRDPFLGVHYLFFEGSYIDFWEQTISIPSAVAARTDT